MGNAAMEKSLVPLKQGSMHEVLNPQLAKDMEAILKAEMELNSIRAKIKKLAAALSTMKNPMLGIQEIMGEFMNESGVTVTASSDVANLDSDIRSEIGDGLNAFNSGSGVNNGTKVSETAKYMKKLVGILDSLDAFIKEQEGSGKSSVADAASLKNLQSGIESIKSQFGKDWGNPTKMASDMKKWNTEAHNHGIYSPQLKKILNGFQTLNQTVSGLSTASNTKLNFVVEQYKQWMGMFQSDNQLILKTTMTEVQNQRTN